MLGLDRTVFSPRATEGVTTPTPAEVPPGSDGTRVAPSPLVTSSALRTRSAVADRLARVARERQLESVALRDAFHPGPTWLTDLAAPDHGMTRQEIESEFERRHTLLAVVTSGDTARVLIESRPETGKPVRLYLKAGDMVSEFKLVLIEDRAAVFAQDDAMVTLALPSPLPLVESTDK